MKQFITVNDALSPAEWVKLAQDIKDSPLKFNEAGKNKTLGLIFFNPSLRTRISTQKAAQNLGMSTIVFNVDSDGWKLEMEDGVVMSGTTQEHIKDAVQVVSGYCDIIGVRSFPQLKDQVADYQEEVLMKFIKYATIPIVSLESATLHPLQSIADALTIHEYSSKKRPKVVLSWAPHPKALPQAVSNSFVQCMQGLDVDLLVTNPEGFDLAPEFLKDTPVEHNQEKALEDADFVYVKNWSSYEDYGRIGSEFEDWMMDTEKLNVTNNAHFMHCLPIRRNVVAADQVIDGETSLVIQQAENRVYAAQAVLLKMLEG